MPLISCPDCKQQVSDQAVACPKCGFPIKQRNAAATADAPRAKLGPIKYLYGGSLLLGVLIAAYIYLVNFDDFSETTLVELTPVWFFFIVLGYYGLVAERMLIAKEESQGERVADSLFEMVQVAVPGPIGKVFVAIVHLPFLLTRSRRSWVVAAIGAGVWALTLWLYFAVVFPLL